MESLRHKAGESPWCKAGFTLMEVLVATAITGMAIGVCMAIFAQGHSQAYRGEQARKAAQVATLLLSQWKAKGKYPASEDGNAPMYDGWSYKLDSHPVSTWITLPSGKRIQIETDKLLELTLRILPPGGRNHFVLTLWVPSQRVEAR